MVAVSSRAREHSCLVAPHPQASECSWEGGMFVFPPSPLVMSCLGSQWLGSPPSSLPIPFPPQPGVGAEQTEGRELLWKCLEAQW